MAARGVTGYLGYLRGVVYRQGFGRGEQVNVLLMEDRVRKLFFETVFIEELLDSPGDDWLLKDRIDVRSSVDIHC